MSRHGHATHGKSDAGVVAQDVNTHLTDEDDAFLAKKEVLRLLKQRPDVCNHIGAPQDASDKELLTSLARTDSPRGTLRAAGYDATSANKAAELLPDALVAVNGGGGPRRSHRPHWWKCCVCAGILFFIAGGLLLGYLHVSVFSKASWSLGTCNIVGFANSSCAGDCLFDVLIKQTGKSKQLTMRYWGPERGQDERTKQIVFVGDAFRCCESQNWDCCGFLDPTTMYFCDNWPHRNAADGTICPGGDWGCLFQTAEWDADLVTELKLAHDEPIKNQFLVASIVFWCFYFCAASSCLWEPYLLSKGRQPIPEVDPGSLKKPSVAQEAKKRQSIGTIHKLYKLKTAQLQDELKATPMDAESAPPAAPDQVAPDLETGADNETDSPPQSVSSPDLPSSAGRRGLMAQSGSSARRPSITAGSERRPSTASISDAPMPRARPSSAQPPRRPSITSETVRPASAMPTVSEMPGKPTRPESASTKSTTPVRPGSAATTAPSTSATDFSFVLDPLSENEPPDFGGDILKKLAAEHSKKEKEFFRPIIDPLDFNSQVARRAARSGSAASGRSKSAQQQRRLRAQTPHPMSAQSEMWGRVHQDSRGSLRPQTAVSRADDPRSWAWGDQGQFMDGHHVVDVGQSPQMSPLRVIASSPTGIMRSVQGTPCNSQTAVRALTQMQAGLGDEVSPIQLQGNFLDDRPRASHGRRASGRNSAIASAAVRETVSRGSARF